jgi:hypothetical protein
MSGTWLGSRDNGRTRLDKTKWPCHRRSNWSPWSGRRISRIDCNGRRRLDKGQAASQAPGRLSKNGPRRPKQTEQCHDNVESRRYDSDSTLYRSHFEMSRTWSVSTDNGRTRLDKTKWPRHTSPWANSFRCQNGFVALCIGCAQSYLASHRQIEGTHRLYVSLTSVRTRTFSSTPCPFRTDQQRHRNHGPPAALRSGSSRGRSPGAGRI